MQLKSLLSTIFFTIIFTSISAQQNKSEVVKIITEWKTKTFEADQQVHFQSFFDKNSKEMQLGSVTEMQLQNSLEGINNSTHHRYRQYYNDIPVFGSMYMLHSTKSGLVKSSNGVIFPDIDININTTFPKEFAINNSKSLFLKDIQVNDLSEITVEDQGLTIINDAFPKLSSEYHLCYQIEISSVREHKKTIYFIDAHTGTQVYQMEGIEHNTVPGKGVSRYYGEVEFNVDSIAPNQFILSDLSKGEGINTFIDQAGNYAKDDDNYWNGYSLDPKDVAIDAHFCTSKFYDIMVEKYNWSGLDGMGKAMNPIVYNAEEGNFVNAFWNGSNAYFGNGNCHYGPLTTMEVVAHEFTHGITDYTSDLIYDSESGAINESMSDVFGKVLEFYEDNENFKWEIGHSFLLDNFTNSFRSMEDPKSRNMPQTYKGQFWNDNGGVHTNSAVGNHFFYRLTEGGNGVTEAGEAFNIEGLGIDKATQIIFEVQKGYLTPTSNYHDYFEYSKIVTADLFGISSPEYTALIESWKVVGIPYETTTGDIKDLSLTVYDNIQSTCGKDVYLPIEIEILNAGNVNISEGENIIINFSLFPENEDYEIKLEEDLLPGESLLITVDDFLLVSETENYYVGIYLIYTDDIASNNNSYYYAQNKVNTKNNLMLNNLNFDFQLCEGNTIETSLRIYNNSCESLQAGNDYILKFIDQNNDIIKEDIINLSNVIQPGGFYNYKTSIDYQGIDSIKATIEFDQDPYLDDNETAFYKSPFDRLINDEYLNLMEDESFLSDFYVEEKNENFFTTYDGSDYLWTTGNFGNISLDICTQELENYNTNSAYGQVCSFETCLDLSTFDMPVLKFNLLQFRNSNAFPQIEYQHYSSMLQVIYETDNGEVFQTLINNQEIGESVYHEYKLPNNSTGILKLQFYNHTGNNGEGVMNVDLDNQLMNNFSIEDESVGTSNTHLIPHAKVYPNPAQDILNIELKSPAHNFELYNNQGMKMMEYQLRTLEEKLELREMVNGVYYAKIYYSDGQLDVIPVFIIK